MAVKVLLFAQLTEVMKAREIIVEEVGSTDELIAVLERKYPGFKDSAYVVAVGRDIIQSNTLLGSESTVALLPPYSGG